MPGFVDVSNMSDQEIKRLGQMDDDEDPRDSNHSHRNLARRNPYGYGRGRTSAQPVGEQYPVAWVWAAAVLATDVNQGYVKEAQYVWDEDTQATKLVKRRNRDIMMDHLQHPQDFTPEVLARGQEVMNFLRNDLTFRALKGRLTEFDASVSKVLAVEDQFHSVQHRYELAVVACLPNSVARSQVRQEADQRMAFAAPGYLAAVGSKVQANVEVLSCNYSQQYNIFWIRGITDDGHAVMFSCKNGHSAKTWLTIQGKVKAHSDNLTRLNYVKVL
jgi:hypothetical protein